MDLDSFSSEPVGRPSFAFTSPSSNTVFATVSYNTNDFPADALSDCARRFNKRRTT